MDNKSYDQFFIKIAGFGGVGKFLGKAVDKVFSPLFVGMEAIGAGREAKKPLYNLGAAKNMENIWKK